MNKTRGFEGRGATGRRPRGVAEEGQHAVSDEFQDLAATLGDDWTTWSK